MAYQYCSKCGGGLDEPSAAEVIAGEIICTNDWPNTCGHANQCLKSMDELLIEMDELIKKFDERISELESKFKKLFGSNKKPQYFNDKPKVVDDDIPF